MIRPARFEYELNSGYDPHDASGCAWAFCRLALFWPYSLSWIRRHRMARQESFFDLKSHHPGFLVPISSGLGMTGPGGNPISRLPELPDLRGLRPQALGVAELHTLHEQLGRWLDAASAATTDQAPDDEMVDSVRAALVSLTRERRERQADERGRR